MPDIQGNNARVGTTKVLVRYTVTSTAAVAPRHYWQVAASADLALTWVAQQDAAVERFNNAEGAVAHRTGEATVFTQDTLRELPLGELASLPLGMLARVLVEIPLEE